MLKLLIQAFYGHGKIENPRFLAYIGDFNFLYFSGALFLICCIIIYTVSYYSEPPNKNNIDGLTYHSLDKAVIRESWDRKEVCATGVILTLVLAIYIYFSFWI
jgi:SSS family solute:Na+ symporter